MEVNPKEVKANSVKRLKKETSDFSKALFCVV